MNSRNLVMLLAIIVGSGLLYITNKDDYSRPDPIPTAIASFSELAVEQVVRVEMMLGDASVVLEREGDDWKVPSAWNYPGDRTEIERLLSDVRSISGAHQRASKAESHGTFQVDDAGGLKLALKDSTGTALAELVIGKADGVQRTFIRLANSDEVYSVAPNLRNRAGFAGWSLEAGRWTDKVLFQLPPDSVVTRMHIETAEGNAQLTLKASPAPGTDNPEPGNPEPAGVLLGSDDPEWMVQFSSNAEPVLADESTVKGIISALKNIQSAEPADPSDSAALGLDPVQSFIEIELADGSIHTVQFGSEVDLSVGGKGVAARVIGQQRTALVRNWVLDSLLQVGETLRAVVEPEEPTAAETPAVEAPAVETPAVE
ncbi:MAG: DUF4340 domain-containing protein, partial [Planctomycetota bacterium]|nr:DUF4340 domain-containing protein [Planctomycetota bacterium]